MALHDLLGMAASRAISLDVIAWFAGRPDVAAPVQPRRLAVFRNQVLFDQMCGWRGLAKDLHANRGSSGAVVV